MNIGRGKFARHRGAGGGRYAAVELHVHEGSTSTIDFACSGAGFRSQGSIEEAPAVGYDDWKRGAENGVRYAFRVLGAEPRHVTVTKIEGMSSDTSPAAVGAAAVMAVFDALAIEPPERLGPKLIDLVFAGDLDAEFPP